MLTVAEERGTDRNKELDIQTETKADRQTGLFAAAANCLIGLGAR